MNNYQAKVAQWKKDEIEIIKNLASKYKLIGVVDLSGLPASQLLKIKAGLFGIAELKMARNSVIERALKGLNKTNIDKVIGNIKGKTALLFTNEDAFKIFKILKKNIAYTKAKAGQIAPKEITIPAGPTNFMAGPMIGELGRVGLKTGVEGGKIVIKEDKLLVKQGETITSDKADLMTKFGIEPIEVGLRLNLTYADGEILTRDVLNIDEEAILNSLANLSREAILLAVEIGYATEETINLLVSKAYRVASGMAKELKITTSENVGDVVKSVEKEALALKEKLDYEPQTSLETVQKTQESKPEVKENVEKPKVDVKVERKQEIKIETVEKPKVDVKVERKEIKAVDISADVENVIQEEARNSVNLMGNADVNLVNKTVLSILGGKGLNTNPKAFENDKPSENLKKSNQAISNFERDAKAAEDFLRKVTDMKIRGKL
ncbi:50S ribosomal protein L10 [Candidatus Woesearchaeota archaeon]|nr:50S ribosomal protein L10 [Candidatus Woesearchaeota archaeon]